jgi:hypothetical protein
MGVVCKEYHSKGFMSSSLRIIEKVPKFGWIASHRVKILPPKQKRQPMAAVGWNFP